LPLTNQNKGSFAITMKNNLLATLLIKLGLINPNKKIAEQLRRPHGEMGRYVGKQMNISNRDLYNFMFENINIANGDTVLEIGYGNGIFFKEIIEKTEIGKLSGIDFSREMYNEAITTNEAFIGDGKLDLHFGNSDAMPFADNSFDKVYCLNVVYFWQQPQNHLKEVMRVLKPNGTFYAGIRTKESMLQLPFTQYGFTMYAPAEWEAVLQQNGFTAISHKVLTENNVEFEEKKFEIKSACVQGTKPTA
jgi:SAM-dependent methyltransferase